MRRKSFVAILVVLLAVTGLLMGRGSQQPASADPFQLNNNLGLLPAEATVLFGLDLDGLLSSAAFATVRSRAEEAMNDPGYRSFKADTGLDVLRDFKGVTGAFWSLPGGGDARLGKGSSGCDGAVRALENFCGPAAKV